MLCEEGKKDEQTKCQRCKTQRVDFERQKKKKQKTMADRSGNVHSIPLGTAKGSRIKIIKPTTSICFRA